MKCSVGGMLWWRRQKIPEGETKWKRKKNHGMDVDLLMNMTGGRDATVLGENLPRGMGWALTGVTRRAGCGLRTPGVWGQVQSDTAPGLQTGPGRARSHTGVTRPLRTVFQTAGVAECNRTLPTPAVLFKRGA